ncbi:hypothetical protein JCM8547_006906 [Rhodosporidiobolus lusitaniae]
MFASLFSSPTVKLTLEEDQIFVHPLAGNFPTTDPVLRGTALVTLPSKRAIKRFSVVLEGICDAYGGDGWQYETTITLHKELVNDFKGEVFEEGNHAFNFSFIIPSSTAVSQRSVHGRIRYYVKAQVEFDGGLLSNTVSSSPTAVWVAANPSPPGELPYPTNLSFEHYSDDLGPVGIHVSSPHFTIASLCNIRLSLLGPPQPVEIVSVNGIITQTFEVDYKNGTTAKPKPRQFTLTKVDERASPSLTVKIHNPVTCKVNPGVPVEDTSSDSSSSPLSVSPPPEPSFRPQSTCCKIVPDEPVSDPIPLARLPAHTEYHYSKILRVPNDDYVRATTLEGTNTCIRVSHKFSVEVRYRKEGDEEDMLLTMGKPITITSCCCMVDSMYLPTYTARQPKTVLRPLMSRCACSYSTKQLFDRDGEALQRASTLETPTSTPRILGIDSDGQSIDPSCKSPSWTDVGSSYFTAPLPNYRGSDFNFGEDEDDQAETEVEEGVLGGGGG